MDGTPTRYYSRRDDVHSAGQRTRRKHGADDAYTAAHGTEWDENDATIERRTVGVPVHKLTGEIKYNRQKNGCKLSHLGAHVEDNLVVPCTSRP